MIATTVEMMWPPSSFDQLEYSKNETFEAFSFSREQQGEDVVVNFQIVHKDILGIAGPRSAGYLIYREGLLNGSPALYEEFSPNCFVKSWYKNGVLHRLDGPAQEASSNDDFFSTKWVVNDVWLVAFHHYANTERFMEYLERHKCAGKQVFDAILEIGLHNKWITEDLHRKIMLTRYF